MVTDIDAELTQIVNLAKRATEQESETVTVGTNDLLAALKALEGAGVLVLEKDYE